MLFPLFPIARLRQRQFRLPSLVCTALLLATAAPTTGAAPALNVLGFDDMSCQAWTQSRGDNEQRALYLAWMRGVLTGHNYARPAQQVSAISSGTIENFVNRYCSEKPRDDFGTAILRLSDQFSGRNTAITK